MKYGKHVLCLVLALMMALSLNAALAEDFTGVAKGFGGDVTVTLTVENGAITAVKAEGASETDGIGTKALEQMPADMVARNSIAVDTVSGATFTSNAVLEAAAAALEAAGLKAEDLVANEVEEESRSRRDRDWRRFHGRQRCHRRGRQGREGLPD